MCSPDGVGVFARRRMCSAVQPVRRVIIRKDGGGEPQLHPWPSALLPIGADDLLIGSVSQLLDEHAHLVVHSVLHALQVAVVLMDLLQLLSFQQQLIGDGVTIVPDGRRLISSSSYRLTHHPVSQSSKELGHDGVVNFQPVLDEVHPGQVEQDLVHGTSEHSSSRSNSMRR